MRREQLLLELNAQQNSTTTRYMQQMREESQRDKDRQMDLANKERERQAAADKLQAELAERDRVRAAERLQKEKQRAAADLQQERSDCLWGPTEFARTFGYP